MDFNNERQRMSVSFIKFQFWKIQILIKVIVEKDNQIYLYCKGGDTKIKERLANSETDIMNQTDEHLNVFILFIFLLHLFLSSIEFCKWEFKNIMFSLETIR